MSTKTLPTLQDVADRAGVSKAVASRAFSKEKKPISEVKKAARVASRRRARLRHESLRAKFE